VGLQSNPLTHLYKVFLEELVDIHHRVNVFIAIIEPKG